MLAAREPGRCDGGRGSRQAQVSSSSCSRRGTGLSVGAAVDFPGRWRQVPGKSTSSHPPPEPRGCVLLPFRARYVASPCRRQFGPGARCDGTHLRSQKTHDVRALEPDGEAVRAHRQGHHDRGQDRGPGPGRQSRAAARHPERARRQHAEGQGRGGDQARLGARRGELRGDPLRGLRTARRRDAGRDRDRQPDAHRRERAQPLQQARRQPGDDRQRRVPVQAHGRLPAEPRRHRRRTTWSST